VVSREYSAQLYSCANLLHIHSCKQINAIEIFQMMETNVKIYHSNGGNDNDELVISVVLIKI
jgi:hypothetical protein